MRALISVANRDGLVDLAQELHHHGVAIYSTSSTLAALQAGGVQAEAARTLTGIPALLDGRVKALHPDTLGGILARRTLHEEALHAHAVESIDIVIVNLYPFVEAVTRQYGLDAPLAEAMEQVDIGGVTLVRAAAKNFQDVLVLVRPQDYVEVMQEWSEEGEVSLETRRRLAAIAFQYIASYDTAIAEYLRLASGECFPTEITMPLERIQVLGYGENPHQQAALYRWHGALEHAHLPTVAGAEPLQGEALTFNDLLDLDVALMAVQSFTAAAVAIVKHTNPCGLACDEVLAEAYKKAHGGDPLSAFGGTIGCNRTIDEATAQEISQLFYEALIAPEFTPGALALLRDKPNLRLLATHRPIGPKGMSRMALHLGRPDVRTVSGGLLVQTLDAVGERETEYRVVTEREPTLEEVTDLMFAWKAVRHVKSNAIVLAHKLMLVGVGAGQMNRVTSALLAIEKAAERARGSVLASDAYFPFADSIETAARAGITAIIQPGGSTRDEECIRAANKYAIAMVFTGKRHFRH